MYNIYRVGFERIKKAVATILAAAFILQPFLAHAAESADTPVSGLTPSPAVTETVADTPTVTAEPVQMLDDAAKEVKSPVLDTDISKPRLDSGIVDASKLSKPEADGGGGIAPMSLTGTVNYYPGFKSDTSVKNNSAITRVDESSGAFQFEYPIPVPDGRNGIQPDLRLRYSSQDRSINENIIGLGWSIPVPYMERFATSGTQDLYFKYAFRSSLSGELVRVSSDRYAARTEKGDFLDYQLANNAWVVKDKKGITYTFGSVSSTQVVDTASSTKIFRWMLTEMRDLNGNRATYSYFKDQGQVYPSQITYTHATGTSGIFTVDFDREARPVTNYTYRPGYLVKTAYRISVIRVSVSGVERYRITLGYDTGDNTANSRLVSLIERYTAADGTQLTKPSMVFGYEKNVAQLVSPSLLPSANSGGGFQIAEVNGDGIPDVIKSHYNSSGISERKVYLGDGFGASSTWNIPTGFELMYQSNGNDIGHRVADMDGDGLSDFIVANEIFRNGWASSTSPTSTWVATGIILPVGFTSFTTWGTYEPNGTYLVDLNRDGFTDILRKDDAYLFNGTRFVTTTAWALPIVLHSYAQDRNFFQTNFTDLNGDGLTDIVYVSGTRALHNDRTEVYTIGYATPTHRFFINTGSGWVDDTSSSTLQSIAANGQLYRGYSAVAQQIYIYAKSTRFVDVNGDGLQDIVSQMDDKTIDVSCGRYVSASIPTWKYYLNTGSGYVTSSNFGDYLHEYHEAAQPSGCTLKYGYYYDLGTNVLDTTGDSVADRANFNEPLSGSRFADNADIGSSDTLTVIGYPEGATTTIRYAGSGQQYSIRNDINSTRFNKQLPLNLRVVDSVETDDRNGTVTSTVYTYEDGALYHDRSRPQDISFAGFGKVTVSSPGAVRTVYFHQGNTTTASYGEHADSFGRIGLPYKIVISDKSGNVYSTELMKYDETSLPSASGEAPRTFVGLARKVVQSYDGQPYHRDVAETYQYDVKGNLIDHLQHGEVTSTTPTSFVDVTGDDRRIVLQYATFSGGASSSLVSQKTELGFGTSTRITRYNYDFLSYGSATSGNLTQILAADASSTLRISTSSTYSGLGLVTSQIDARGNTTTFAYDSVRLFSVTTTNPLGQYVTTTYDYFFGEPTRIRDENGQIKRMVYDPAGRPKEFYGPDAAASEVKLWDVAYSDTRNAVSTLKNTYFSATSTDVEYVYFDGYGRDVQSKKTTYGSNWIAKWKRYDGEGREFWTMVPTFSVTSASTTAYTDPSYRIQKIYEPTNRLKTLITTLGSTQYSNAPWTETITDPLGKVKKIKRDAYGRIVEVVERSSGIDYSTKYTYDHFGNLLSITDATGNIRNFTYDALGRRTAAEDVRAVSDTSFLKILYAYDKNGNVTVEHRSDKTSQGFTYDKINRPLTIAHNSTTVYTLTYDACGNGVGRLCRESTANYQRSFVYSPHGYTTSTSFVYGATSYNELATHDWQGRVTSSTLPDGSSLGYIYQGWQLLRLNAKESAATTTTPIITNVVYDPSQAPEVTYYGNGAVTLAQRDSTKLYRLNGLRTSFGGGPFFQELEYYYDSLNRVTEMRELDATSTKRRVVYGYDDLDRLVSAYASTTGAGPLLYRETYSYDPVGNFLTTNLLDASGTSTTSTYSYGSPSNANTHAVTAVSSTRNNVYQGYTSLAYDLRGNVGTTTWYNASGTEDISLRRVNRYDPANQMLATGLGSATQTLLYLYDKDGMRITQKFATSTIVYSSPTYNATISATGTRIDTEKHIGDGMRTLATIDGTGLGARYLYNHPDHLTGANVITTGARTFEEVLDYMPFGGVRVDSKAGSWSEQRQYAGHDFDQTSGYSYMKARYYDPQVKRFLGEDKVFWGVGYDLSDPQMANSYSYARNTPITHLDPDGNSAKTYFAALMSHGPAIVTGLAAGAVTAATAAAAPVTVGIAGVGALSVATVGIIASGVESAKQLPSQLPQLGRSIQDFAAQYSAVPQDDRDAMWGNIFGGTTAIMSPHAGGAIAGGVIGDSSQFTTLKPGRYAGESIPARGAARNFTAAERSAIDRIGSTRGCHSCGTTNPGTRSGHFVPDHQPPSGLIAPNQSQRLYPQCINCSRVQAGQVTQMKNNR